MPEIVMPRLSDSMEEGTILQWLKSVGDDVALGDELVEIETDKANMAYESDVAGTLTEIVVEEGETVPIGATIARVDGEGPGASPAGPVGAGDPPPLPVAKASSGEVPPTPPPAGEGVEKGPTTPEGDGRPKASPVARRIAKEKGLDLSELRGSGPGGRIVKADVEKAEASAAPTPSPAAVSEAPETAKGQTSFQDLTKLQSTIARRMAESKATAPHFYLEAEVDMSRAVEARARIKGEAGEGDVVPSFNDMVVKACALALREHPRANGAYRDGRFELYSRVNVGIAVAGQDALVVPTVFDADRKGLRQIAEESRALARRVRDGQITPPELSGATFTVSNLGMYGIDSFSAVINPPQAGILAVGAIKECPVARDGEIATAQLMRVNLACDHRILYGADGAEFLARIRTLLEEPLALAL
ncbi:MAG TPA: dihydrolipoamide acetyltransferase family protein [Solirubrobacterales bacterium]|nr:dihydrolipoamide acetyltransferase family protein [Solirubrobacterales bacterium]